MGAQAILAQMTATISISSLFDVYPNWLTAAETQSGPDSCHAIYCPWNGDSSSPILILGGNAVPREKLQELGVTHVLSVIAARKKGQKPAGLPENDGDEDGFTRLLIDADDDIDEDLACIFDKAHSFLDECVSAVSTQSEANKAKSLCYVHCEMGRSRSATTVISYLMNRRALELISSH